VENRIQLFKVYNCGQRKLNNFDNISYRKFVEIVFEKLAIRPEYNNNK